jgi:hypothetical protein
MSSKLKLFLIKDNKAIIVFLSLACLYCLQNGVSFSPDSGTYISHGAIRTGLYPLTISVFQSLLKGYGLQALVGFQIVFAITAIYMIVNFLKITFNLTYFLQWICLSVFLIPLFIFQSANGVLSEGLAYPLFLLTSYFFLKGILEKTIKHLYLFSFFLSLLVFTRQQYLFFYGIAIVAILFFMAVQRNFPKKGLFILSVALSLGGIFVSERAYHYVYHGSFASTPFTGIQLIIRPLYLAPIDAYKDFSDLKQQQFVKEVLKEVAHQKIVDTESDHYRTLEGFHLYYNTIQHQICPSWLAKIWEKEDLKDKIRSDFEYTRMLDKEMTLISFRLIRNNFIKYSASYIKDFILGAGGFSYLGLVFFFNLLCLRNIFWCHDKNPIYYAVIFATLIHLGNLAVICLVEPPLIRYTYSTNILLFTMLIVMGYQLFQNTLFSKTSPSCVA